MAMGFFFGTEFVDPDFDEELDDLALLQHEIDADGVIPIHPDGDRRSADYDPVPLHTRVYNDGSVAELKKREWKKHLEDRKAWAQEAKVRAMELPVIEMREIETVQHDDGYSQQLALPALPPTPVLAMSDPDLMANMKLDKPLRPGQGRVWGSYVMIREEDQDKWRQDQHRRSLPQVWRGRWNAQGFVIFKLR